VEALVLRRDDEKCFRCGRSVYSFPRSCHHRQLRSGGGPDAPRNRITACGTGTTGCHGWMHHHRGEAEAGGWIVSRYRLPELVPALHWRLGPVLLTDDLRMVPWQEGATDDG
jgi:hypothetical protein